MEKTSKIFAGLFLVFSLLCTSISAFAIEPAVENETESPQEISSLTTILKNANVNDNGRYTEPEYVSWSTGDIRYDFN